MANPLCPYCKVPTIMTHDFHFVCPKCGAVVRPLFDEELEELPTIRLTSMPKTSVSCDSLIPKKFSEDYTEHRKLYSEEIYLTRCLDRWKHHKRATSYCAVGARVLALIDKGLRRDDAILEVTKLYPWWSKASALHALKMVLASIVYPPKEV